MKLLMIVGSADSIFIYHLAKWLKQSMDINIDIYELERTDKRVYDNKYYDSRNYPFELPILKTIIRKAQLAPLWRSRELKRYLKGTHYDVIHCHWLTNSLVITKNLKKYCDNLCVTFWGGELSHQMLFKSHSLYMIYLNKFIEQVDYIVNSDAFNEKVHDTFPNYKGQLRHGQLGSSPVQFLVELMQEETKDEAKKKMELPIDKKIVMIGYSGKSLHQHLPIIKELEKDEDLKNKIHLFAPMTRDTQADYVKKVEDALKNSDYTYTLLKDRYLTDEEVARIRMVTDIVFQFSLFDDFSRSIIECICAKAFLLYGDWLNYTVSLNEFGFKAESNSTIADGVLHLKQVVDNFSIYEPIIEENANHGKKRLLWSECIKDWVKLYQSF